MYKIGEALVGKDNEVAHIDLIIGDKEGNVGEAFANGLAKLSAGHTPVLSVIRPNLPSKPYTLVIPKITIKDMEDANKIFGPAQAAVAKAVADAVEEGIIPRDKIEDWVIICSVFVHPEAKDFRKIYQYNYGATKLALKRALQDYPSLDKIMFDKDRATHPIMGFRVPRLPKWNRPYLQIALDIPDLERTKKIIREIPKSDKIILEAGTPLIKKYGTKVINELREVAKSDFIIADLKTLDVGQVEVDLAFDDGADAVVASGLATVEVIDKFIYEAKRLGIYAILDMMNVEDPVKRLKSLKELPHIVILHRAIDSEKSEKHRFGLIRDIKKEFPDLYVAVAGGIEPETVPLALKEGVDIIIVGRFITQSKDIERSTRLFINQLGGDIDLKRVHVE
ncbi:MAG: formaldehyde-activating enzyme [Candidatus Altiarchaeales archaeon]|nr:MAG: formaldehyde-activating enzyme [Candidatus Altiarchaeales archaeon]